MTRGYISSIIKHMLRLIIALLLIISYPTLLFAHPEGTGQHVVEAYRIEGEPPQIDGVLDDTVWERAASRSGFIQLEPARGLPQRMTQNSVSLTMSIISMSHSDVTMPCQTQIVNRMTRRGDVYASDVISFFIDPHHDHRTGYKFATNPAGVQSDNYRYEDTQRDSNWKGIWWV